MESRTVYRLVVDTAKRIVQTAMDVWEARNKVMLAWVANDVELSARKKKADREGEGQREKEKEGSAV